MTGPSLRVGAGTTVDDLQRFAFGLKDGDRLRGRRSGSEVILYVKSDYKGVKGQFAKLKSAFLEGGARQKRSLARAAVDGVLKRSAPKVEAALLSTSREALNKGMRHDMKGLSLQAIVGHLPRSRTDESAPASAEIAESASALADILLAAREQADATALMPQAPVVLADGQWETISLTDEAAPAPALEVPDADLDAIGNALGRDLRSLDQAAKDRLVIGAGRPLDQIISDKTLEKMNGQPDADRKTVDASAQRIANAALASIADGRLVSDDKMMMSGGSVADRERHLGQGGFAKVDLFKDADTQEPIAFKYLKEAVEAGSAEALLAEATAHRLASGHDDIVAFKGLIMSEGGKPGIAMEYMANGDAGHLRDFLSGRYQSSVPCTARDRKDIAIVFADKMSQAMSHIKAQGLSHRDFKPENAFINAKGQLKMGDFGLTGKNTDYIFNEVVQKRNKDEYTSPAYWQQDQVAMAHENNFDEKLEGRKNAVNDRFKSAGLSGSDKQHLLDGVANHGDLVRDYGIGRGLASTNDAWGFGASVFSLVYGKSPIQGMVCQSIVDFSENQETTMIDTNCPPGGVPGAGFLHPSTGDADLDDLLNKLLPSGSREPMPVEDVRSHPAMRGQSKSTSAVEAQIAALTSQPHHPTGADDHMTEFQAMVRDAEDMQI